MGQWLRVLLLQRVQVRFPAPISGSQLPGAPAPVTLMPFSGLYTQYKTSAKLGELQNTEP